MKATPVPHEMASSTRTSSVALITGASGTFSQRSFSRRDRCSRERCFSSAMSESGNMLVIHTASNRASLRCSLSGRLRISVRAHKRQNHRCIPMLVNPFRTICLWHWEHRFFRHGEHQLGNRFSNRIGKDEKTPQLRCFLCTSMHTEYHLARFNRQKLGRNIKNSMKNKDITESLIGQN